MSKPKENKTYTLDSVIDEVIRKVGTPKRDEFEKRITKEIQKETKLI